MNYLNEQSLLCFNQQSECCSLPKYKDPNPSLSIVTGWNIVTPTACTQRHKRFLREILQMRNKMSKAYAQLCETNHHLSGQ